MIFIIEIPPLKLHCAGGVGLASAKEYWVDMLRMWCCFFNFKFVVLFLLLWWWLWEFYIVWWCADVCSISVSIHNKNTFWLHVKFAWMNILCTLAHLCEETLLQPLQITFFNRLFLALLLNFLSDNPHNWHFSFFGVGKYNKGKCAVSVSVICSPTITPPQHIPPPPPPTYHLPPYKVISIPMLAIFCHRILLEEGFPCVEKNIFSVKSHCFNFAIDTTWPTPVTPTPWCGNMPDGKLTMIKLWGIWRLSQLWLQKGGGQGLW